MKIKTKILYTIIPAALMLSIAIVTLNFETTPDLSGSQTVEMLPPVRPDYSSVTIPPNIAPMNFNIELEADKYFIRLYSDTNDKIEVISSSSIIKLPEKPWHKLLQNNKGKSLNIDIYTKTKNNNWQKYKTITNFIAKEDVDSYLFYRTIHPSHYRLTQNGPVQIIQHNLTNSKENILITGKSYYQGCVNCHSPLNNKTDKMTIGIRSDRYGTTTLYINGDKIQNIAAKIGYNSWHPSGKIIAYSTNNIRRFFYSAKNEMRDAVDEDSMITYYNVETHKIIMIDEISKKDKLETFPTWSTDGKYLYYCCSDKTWDNMEKIPPDGYYDLKYDLMRISYNIDKDVWGKPEIVISASEAKKSILMPRISPDGRWLVTCMVDNGGFPVWPTSSDLYITDLNKAEATGIFNYEKLSLNTDLSQSWHSFSSNSRWLAYSSKQQNGLFTRIYLAYIDENGQSQKSFIVPQKNPLRYDSTIESLSFPELTTGPMRISAGQLAAAIRNSNQIKVDIPVTMATPEEKSTKKLPPHQKSLTPYTEIE